MNAVAYSFNDFMCSIIIAENGRKVPGNWKIAEN